MMMNSVCLPRLPHVLALLLAATLLARPALAQGTDEQREACAPDAIKLCENTIPDVARTTACMKRHFAQLSPRCRTAFNDAVGSKPSARARTSREPPTTTAAPADETVVVAAPERLPGLASYEAHIRDICRKGLVDAFTCRNTLDLLKAGE